MPASQINFTYKINGDLHEIDVFNLAPTLLALGELIQKSNLEVGATDRQIGVNVRPFREGSFIVELSVFPQTHFQQFLDFLTTSPVEQVKTLLEWIGLITGAPLGVIGVIQLIKFLKGKPKNVEEVRPGEFRYTATDDRSITVNAPVHTLASNSTITNNIYKVYVQPIEQHPSVTDVQTYIGDEPQSSVSVTRDEIPAVKEFVNASAEVESPAEKITEIVHYGVFLNPKRGSFDGDPKDWSFYRGEEIVTATIKDKDFLKKYEIGDYRLNYSDLLTVDLLEKQRVLGTKVMKPVYEIVRVTDYRKGTEQASIGED